MFRAVIPILKKSSLAAGQELLRSGANLVGDVWKTGDLKDAQKKRGKEFISNVSNRVSDHMFGSGYSHLMGRTPLRYSHLMGAQLKSSSRGKKSRKTVKRKPVKRKTQKRKNVKSRAKTVKKKKKQNTGRSKQNIQDIFT